MKETKGEPLPARSSARVVILEKQGGIPAEIGIVRDLTGKPVFPPRNVLGVVRC